MVEDKNTNENAEANDVRPKRVGITLIPYFIKTNHLDIIYIMENGIAYLFSSRELFCHLNSTQGFFSEDEKNQKVSATIFLLQRES